MHACMHACIHACMHAYIHAYMHTCIHAYIQTCEGTDLVINFVWLKQDALNYGNHVHLSREVFRPHTAQEIAMSANEEDLKLRVGDGDWRPLRVRQFEVTETQVDGEIPEWLRFSNMSSEITNKFGAKDDAVEPDDMEEIDKMHAEGGKHAYIPLDENSENEDAADTHDDCLEEDDIPDWIQCFKGVKFFTLNQALNTPAAMQIRF